MSDEELHPVSFAQTAANDGGARRVTEDGKKPQKGGTPAGERRPDQTVTVGDDEVESVQLSRSTQARAPSVRPPAKVKSVFSNADPLIGRVIADRYKILSLLGRGAMGVVYKVEHVHIGKLMAMKLLSGELAAHAATVRRFRREATAISKLAHVNTVQVFDFGEKSRLVYLVMEYLPGRDLGSIIADEGPLPFVRVAKLGAQIAASVSEAHDQGIIHRDIKPENVMVLDATGESDFVKVLDFGIAQLREHEDSSSESKPGSVVGTPFYMSPEQIRGERSDARTDIYALGALMYKAATGVPPFPGDTADEVMTRHLNDPLVSLRERTGRDDLPEEADAIIARAMSKDREQRYPSMHELRADLLSYLARVEGPESAVQKTDEASRPSRESLRPGEALATRGDIDRYESKLRSTNRLARRSGAVASFVGVLLLFWLYRSQATVASTVEVEPNNDPNQANLLLPGLAITGQLAKRLSYAHGDADVYQVDVPLESTQVARVQVTALPNIDIVLEVARKGTKQPLLMVNTGGVGEPEHIPNFTLPGGTYFVRVRESWQPKALPTENISDSYAISLELRAPRAHEEREPNDGFETAETVAFDDSRSGFLGWAGDRDLYCFKDVKRDVRVEVTAPKGLDLVLASLDRGSSATREVNRADQGGTEVLELPYVPTASLCVEVRAFERPGAAQANFEQPYSLRVREGSPPAPVAAQKPALKPKGQPKPAPRTQSAY